MHVFIVRDAQPTSKRPLMNAPNHPPASSSIDSVESATLHRILNHGVPLDPDNLQEYSHRQRTALKIADILVESQNIHGLSDGVIESAAQLFVDAQNADLIVGKSVEATAGACLRLAGLESDEIRPFAHLGEGVGADPADVRHQTLKLARALEVEYRLIEPGEYISFLAEQLGLDSKGELIHRAGELCEQVDLNTIGATSPVSIAASAIYAAARERDPGDLPRKLRQEDVARAAKLTDTTVRNSFKQFFADAIDSAG